MLFLGPGIAGALFVAIFIFANAVGAATSGTTMYLICGVLLLALARKLYRERDGS